MKEKQQYILSIKCGIRYSALVSSNGKLWMCGNRRHEKLQRYENTEEAKIEKDKEFSELT